MDPRRPMPAARVPRQLVILMIVAAGLGALVAGRMAATLLGDASTAPPITVDDGAMDVLLDQLAALELVLDSLPTPRGSSSTGATVAAVCTVDDDGTLRQPSIARSWRLDPGVDPEDPVWPISGALIDGGWSVAPVADRTGRRAVRLDHPDGWTAAGTLAITEVGDGAGAGGSAIELTVAVRGAAPCTLASSSP